MAISVNNIENADYEDFLQITINDYAESKVKNKVWPAAESLSYAWKAFNTLLPDGRDTPDQYFKAILHHGQKAGYLWYEIRAVNPYKVLFINYIYILPAFRNLGLGKEAIEYLKTQAAALGAHRIELHVFGFNTTAYQLYLKSGFEQTNITMRYEVPEMKNQ